MADLEAERLWQSAFRGITRPVLYVQSQEDDYGFQRLSDPQSFVADVSKLSQLQLYACSANNQVALTQAQTEYLQIGRRISALKGKDPKAKKNPQSLLTQEEFEDRKEATLYSYKYEIPKPALLHNGISGNRVADNITDQEKRDVRLFPNPFEQGGFVPTERQYKAMAAKATDPLNIDGWIPMAKDGKQLIPRRNLERPEYTNVYVKRNIDENGEVIRPTSSGTDESNATPSKPVTLEDKRLTRTRYDGNKTPATRDVSEDPSLPSTPGRKRAAPGAVAGRDGVPAIKRRRPNGDDRPRHANQYTKAKEVAAAQQTAKGTANGGVPSLTPAAMPDLSAMTPAELRARKWTDDELTASIKANHAWLNDDPAKALEWRDKILNGLNPVRSWSMVKKWAEWKDTNKDKRPRKKAVAAEADGGETQAVDEAVAPLGGLDMARMGSEGGSERGRRGVRPMGTVLNGPVSRSVDASVNRSETSTPTQRTRRSQRTRV